MSTLVGKKAPSFKASAVVNGGEIVNGFSLDQYLGKNHVLFFFYPKDFTLVQQIQKNHTGVGCKCQKTKVVFKVLLIQL